MENKKEILWSVLEKYDGVSNLNKFCDSISNFIQNKQNGNDIINVYRSLDTIEQIDRSKISKSIGGDIDSFLFAI